VIRFVINVVLVLWLGLLVAATIESHRSADWSRVQGLSANPGKEKETQPDLLSRMENATWRRNAPVEFTEAEVNRYLARVVSGREHGPTARAATFDRVALDFEPGNCRVLLSWNVAGRETANAALDFTLKREGENFVWEPHRGSYGRLPVFRGMMCALMPALKSLCAALDDEIGEVFKMNQVRFDHNKVVLDPRTGAGK
jgi:hypothetical protein